SIIIGCPSQCQVVVLVHTYLRAGRDDDGGVIFVNQKRAALTAVNGTARDDRRIHQAPFRAKVRGPAGRRRFAGEGGRLDKRRLAASRVGSSNQSQRHHLDRRFGVRVTV